MIECHVHVGMTDDEAKVLEITENLEREDLTSAERRKWAKELLVINTRIEASFATNDAKLSKRGRKGEGRPEAAASKVAKATGLSKRTVQRLQKDMQEAGELPATSDRDPATIAAEREAKRAGSLNKSRAEPTIPGHTSSKDQKPYSVTDGLLTEEGTEAPNVAKFHEAKKKRQAAKELSYLALDRLATCCVNASHNATSRTFWR